jgi:hypothetical protein
MTTSPRFLSMPLITGLFFALAGCAEPHDGSISVSGHYRAGPALREAPATSSLNVVVRGHNSPSWMSSQGISRDTTCWSNPLGCPYLAEFKGLREGKYLVSMEMHDAEYVRTGGTSGTATVLGYYAVKPLPADSAINVLSPSEADTVLIGNLHRAHSIMLNIH